MLLKHYIEEYGDGGKTTPEDRQKEAFDFLVNKGLSKAQASGVVGNLIQESGHKLDTKAIGDKNLGPKGEAYGIAQWRLDRKDNLQKIRPKDYDTFKGQMEFLWWELNNTEKKAYKALLETDTPEKAAYVFGKEYERPKVVEPVRGINAQRVYTAFSGLPNKEVSDTVEDKKETDRQIEMDNYLASWQQSNNQEAPVITSSNEENKIDFFNFGTTKELEEQRAIKEQQLLQGFAQQQQEMQQRQAEQQDYAQQDQEVYPEMQDPYNYISIEEY